MQAGDPSALPLPHMYATLDHSAAYKNLYKIVREKSKCSSKQFSFCKSGVLCASCIEHMGDQELLGNSWMEQLEQECGRRVLYSIHSSLYLETVSEVLQVICICRLSVCRKERLNHHTTEALTCLNRYYSRP